MGWINDGIMTALTRHREAPLDVVLVHYGSTVKSEYKKLRAPPAKEKMAAGSGAVAVAVLAAADGGGGGGAAEPATPGGAGEDEANDATPTAAADDAAAAADGGAVEGAVGAPGGEDQGVADEGQAVAGGQPG